MEEATIIELTPLMAEQWIEFQKNYSKFITLFYDGAFDLKDGSIEIHVDSGGHWKNVVTRRNHHH